LYTLAHFLLNSSSPGECSHVQSHVTAHTGGKCKTNKVIVHIVVGSLGGGKLQNYNILKKKTSKRTLQYWHGMGNTCLLLYYHPYE
jgi:hypothetical protein